MTDPMRANGKHPFSYQAPTPNQVVTIKDLRDGFWSLYERIVKDVYPSRERSLALTKLEEANMWVNKAIVFSDDTN